jgi:predicted SAM-dependent methyltransferase
MAEKDLTPRLVYLGCGHDRMKDFIHVEINLGKNKSGPPDILADISDYIPIKDNSVDLVFSRATLEHLTYNELLNCLLESHRILKKGGCVRIVVPDFDKTINQYLNKVYRDDIKNPGMPNENYVDTFVARIMYHDHRYNHNFDTLRRALEKTGFEQIRECQPGDSKIEVAREELRKAEMGREKDDIIVEAVKFNKKPIIQKTERVYPKNPIAYFLAKFFNIKAESFVKGKARFPQRYWFKTLINFNKSKKQ